MDVHRTLLVVRWGTDRWRAGDPAIYGVFAARAPTGTTGGESNRYKTEGDLRAGERVVFCGGMRSEIEPAWNSPSPTTPHPHVTYEHMCGRHGRKSGMIAPCFGRRPPDRCRPSSSPVCGLCRRRWAMEWARHQRQTNVLTRLRSMPPVASTQVACISHFAPLTSGTCHDG